MTMHIYRRRIEYSLIQDPSTEISDAQLRIVLQAIKQDNPELGEVMVLGIIRSMGYRVSREKIRQEIREIDPLPLLLDGGVGKHLDDLIVSAGLIHYGILVSWDVRFDKDFNSVP